MYIYIHAGVPVGSRGLYLSAEKGVFLVTWTRRLMKSHVRLRASRFVQATALSLSLASADLCFAPAICSLRLKISSSLPPCPAW